MRKMPGNDVVQRAVVNIKPVFAQDFPEGPLKTQLEALIDIRALLKLAEVEITSTTYYILKDDNKTAARVVVESLQDSVRENGDPENALASTTYVHLKPVIGHTKQAHNLQQYFEEKGLNLTEDNLYLKALTSSGKQPGGYSSKLNFSLDPQMRSDEAAKIILRFLYIVN